MHIRRQLFPALPLLLMVIALSAPLSSPLVAAEGSAVPWQVPGSELDRAAKEGKPVLYFFTAEWCAPCHQMKATLFADAERAARITEWFVPVEVVDTRVETGSNAPEVEALERRYRIDTVPTLLIAHPGSGDEVDRMRGYTGAEPTWQWLEALGAPLAASRPASRTAASGSR